MYTRMLNNIRKMWKKDRGSMTQVLLISLMIPTTVALIVSTALTQLFLQYEDNRRTDMISATEEAGSYLLNDINTKLPSRFVQMSPEQLASETKHIIPGMNADTYVSSFTVDTDGWIQAVIVVDLLDAPGQPSSYSVQYRPTKATVFKGFDATTKRPIWAFTDTTANPNASLEPLGLFEQVPVVSSIADYPSINRPGTKAAAPQNLRILRSTQFGVVLAWDKPNNATAALLTGYRIDSTKNSACYNKSPDVGKEVLAAGYIVLSTDKNSTNVASWNCSSADATNLVSVRGLGQVGAGIAAFIKLGELPTYDLDNLVPVAPANLTYTKTGGVEVLTWDEQACNFGYNIEFRLTKVTNNNAAGNYGVIRDWNPYVASGGKFTYTLTTAQVLQGSTQGWVAEARCLHATFGGSSPSVRSNEAKTTTVVASTAAVSNATITGLTAGTGTFTAAACTTGNVTGLTAQYKVTYSKRNNVASTELIRDWNTSTASVAVSSGLGSYAAIKVESRCASANSSPIYGTVLSSTSADWLAGVPAPTGTLSVTNNGTTGVSWSGITCAANGTPQYYVTQTKTNGATTTTVLGNWITTTSATGTAQAGYDQTVSVKARCVIAGNPSTETAATSTSWTRNLVTPTALVTGVTNNAAARISWTAYSGCEAATSPQYRVNITKLNAGVTNTYSAYSANAYYDLVGSYQGYPQAGKVQVRCVATNAVASSPNGLSAETAWTSNLAAPAAPTIYSVTGNYFTAYWYAVGCSAGASVAYYIYVDFDSTRIGDSGWITATGWSRPTTNRYATWIYWNTSAYCNTGYRLAQSGWNQLRQ